jgi:hypothetical protein
VSLSFHRVILTFNHPLSGAEEMNMFPTIPLAIAMPRFLK